MIKNVTVCCEGSRIVVNSKLVLHIGNFRVPFNKVKQNSSQRKQSVMPKHLQERYTELACEKLLRAIGFS